MIVAVVRFTLPDPMTEAQARDAFTASAPTYQTIPGLRRKHYLLSDDGRTAGGVYLWDTREQAEATYDAAWRERLTERYGAAPTVEWFTSPVTVDPTSIMVS
jgi:Putative mono-oxygenase ydhR